MLAGQKAMANDASNNELYKALMQEQLKAQQQSAMQKQAFNLKQQGQDADVAKLQAMVDSGLVPEGSGAKIGDVSFQKGFNPLAATSLNQRNVNQAQRAVNSDHILTQYVQRADGAKKILALMEAAEKGDFKSNQALLGQLNAEISRLETGSQSPGLHSAEKTEMLDSAAHLHNVLDTLSGNVTGVDLTQKFAQARGMVKDLGSSYHQGIDARLNSLKAGSLPEQMPVYDAKRQEILSHYGDFAPDKLAAERQSRQQMRAQTPTQSSGGIVESALGGLKRLLGSPGDPPAQAGNFSGVLTPPKQVRQKSSGKLFNVGPDGDMTEVQE